MSSHLPVDGASETGPRGYAHQRYASSLEEFGTIIDLPACGGWLLGRPIPSAVDTDGVGCYPLFCCQDWRAIHEDLNALAGRLVCVSLVTDPFAPINFLQLCATFPDVCYEYKQHFVTDLSLPLDSIVGSHHRRNVRKAIGSLDVRLSTTDDDLASNWQLLYDNLAERHRIEGIARFSSAAFKRQLTVPGITAFSAFDGPANCGTTLWYVSGDVAYYHLGAYSDRGYQLGASFALFWTAFTHFAKLGIRWAALGAGAGATPSESGLTRFKQGWATHTRPVFFCGRILKADAYWRLAGNCEPGSYFPAYRRPNDPADRRIEVA